MTWQLAVYSPLQHEQHRVGRMGATLVKSGPEGRWRLLDALAEVPTPPDATSLVVRPQREGEALTLSCQGVKSQIELAAGGTFSSRVPIELAVPTIFELDGTWFEIKPETAHPEALGLEPLHGSTHDHNGSKVRHGPNVATVAKWLAAVGELHRTAASSDEFFARAAEIVVQSTGLDAAITLVRYGDRWQIAGSAVQEPRYGVSFDTAALELLLAQPDVWRRPASSLRAQQADWPHQPHSRVRDSLVVAPVRGETGEIVAALYGVRHCRGDNRRMGVRALETRVVEVLADGVAVGIARRQREIDSARRQVLLEQTFSPEVAQYLLRHPAALAGQTREATILLADLRGFTQLAESLAAAESCDLLAATMEALTEAIVNRGGVVIDYYGDGVSALWNAPFDQPDHADRACHAALDMLAALPRVNQQWRRLLSEPLELVIGLHSGLVQVGNAGTRRRLKYGPRGATVNLASRVQSAAKRLALPLLATDAVQRRLSSQLTALKVCTARLPGFEGLTELFTIFPAADAARLQRDLERYSLALAAFEVSDFDRTERELLKLLAAGPTTPAAFLSQQTTAFRRRALNRRADDAFSDFTDGIIEILTK